MRMLLKVGVIVMTAYTLAAGYGVYRALMWRP